MLNSIYTWICIVQLIKKIELNIFACFTITHCFNKTQSIDFINRIANFTRTRFSFIYVNSLIFLYPVIVLLIDAYLILFFSLSHKLHTLSQKFLFNSESVWCCFIFRGEKSYHTLQEVIFLIMIVIYFLKVCVISQ